MGQEYKGYSFDVLIKPVAGNNRWTFTTVVHIPQGARDRVTELNSTQDFASEAEAGNGSDRIREKVHRRG